MPDKVVHARIETEKSNLGITIQNDAPLEPWELEALEEVKLKCQEFKEEVKRRRKDDPKGMKTLREFRSGDGAATLRENKAPDTADS